MPSATIQSVNKSQFQGKGVIKPSSQHVLNRMKRGFKRGLDPKEKFE